MESKSLLTLVQVQEILSEIKQRTKRKAYRLEILPNQEPALLDSKFGGLPYWDMEQPYPTDSYGEKMLLLAQIRLDGLPKLGNPDQIELPDHGLLQFFCAANDVYGLFNSPNQQKDFRVVYHQQIDASITAEQLHTMGIPSVPQDFEETPVFHAAPISISIQETSMNLCDYRFADLAEQIALEKYHTSIAFDDFYLVPECETYLETYWEDTQQTGHWLLGYPFFTQEDPRVQPVFSHYDRLLLQIDSDCIEQEDYILWEDCGVGNFFASQADLKAHQFSNILYNWDCC